MTGPIDATDSPEPASQGGPGGVDASRVRSFIGLSVGLVGPRANLAVSGVLITLFVQQRATSALAVTFALTADRLVSWLTFPVAGRLSDRTRSRVGRRTPYMAGSLMLMGVATWMFTVVHGYWLLVLMILIAGQASATFTLTNVAVVPEVFGRSRWIKALLLTTVLGTLASWTIKVTVITSWKQSNPATWNLPFQVDAVILVAVGLVVLLLVREAPAASYGAAADRKERARPTREEIRNILAQPNAKVLIGGSLLFWSGVGSTAYVAILFFQRVLHAGASAQTVAGLVTGIPVFFIGIGLGIPLSRKLSPMTLAIGAPLVGAVLAGVQYFDTHLWQAVVLAFVGAPFIGAYVIVMAPLLLRLLPTVGGLGERIGVLLAPFNLCSVVLAYIAAIVIDATGNYRLIWLFPAVTGLCHAAVNTRLRYPAKKATSPDMVKQLWEWAIVQAESMAETGIVTGLLAAPLLGVVTEEDADSAVVIDMARNILGNPYELDDPPTELPAGGAKDGGSGQEDSPGGSLGVTGVDQVGGGPAGDWENGDQKLGRGADSSSSSAPSTPSVGDRVSGSPGTAGVPETGVAATSADHLEPGTSSVPVSVTSTGSDRSSGSVTLSDSTTTVSTTPDSTTPDSEGASTQNGGSGATSDTDAASGHTSDAGSIDTSDDESDAQSNTGVDEDGSGSGDGSTNGAGGAVGP